MVGFKNAKERLSGKNLVRAPRDISLPSGLQSWTELHQGLGNPAYKVRSALRRSTLLKLARFLPYPGSTFHAGQPGQTLPFPVNGIFNLVPANPATSTFNLYNSRLIPSRDLISRPLSSQTCSPYLSSPCSLWLCLFVPGIGLGSEGHR